MSKALIVGSGMVGSEIAHDLSRSPEFSTVTVVDANKANLARVESSKKIRPILGDVLKGPLLAKLLDQVDLVCGALPGRLGFLLMKRVIEQGKNLVDISYTPEDPFQLDKLAKRNGCLLIPQCGVAPGLSNICVGNASSRLANVARVRILVGGLPQHPVPPLNYEFVFSPDDVINEYTREATIIKNGRVTKAPSLSGRGELMFPSVGRLEYFLTDGLGTLTESFTGVDEMGEYTLRYPGHATLMDSLRMLGMLEKKPVTISGAKVEPRKLVLEFMKPLMAHPGRGDLLAFRVEVDGRTEDRKSRRISYRMLDFYNPRTRVSAMARTTAYTCTAVANLVARRAISATGVVPPEKIGRDQRLFRWVKSYLSSHGVKLHITG